MTQTTISQIRSSEGQRGATAPPAALTQMPQSMIPTRGWMWIVVLATLFVGLHLKYLELLFRVVTNARGDSFVAILRDALVGGAWNPDWSHVLVIPLISLYFLYLWRDRLTAAPIRPNGWGLAILAFGMLSYTWWIFPGRNDMFQGYSMVIALFGLVLFLLGGEVMKIAWFPIAYLLFGVKIAGQVWEQIAWKMQSIAASVSHVVLQFLGLVLDFEAEKSGNQLTLVFMKSGRMVSETMNVAEACSGLRMLMAFIALAVALAFITPRPWWQRVLMIGLAVPVAIVVNVGRVTAIGLLNLVNPEYARGDFHTFVGLLMLIPAGLLILFIGWCANRIFITDAAATSGDADAPPLRPAAAPAPTLPPAQHTAAIAQGVALGAAMALALGGAYAGMWALSASPLAGALPYATLMALMMAALVLSAVGVALIGRAGLRALVRKPGSRLPLAAGLAAGMLATAWIGQQSAIAYTRVVLIKKETPTRLHLTMVPQQIGPWKMISDQGDQMTKEVIEVLGTTNFISRLYVNDDLLPGLERIEDLSRSKAPPGAIARLHVAYYTGNPDAVPHVPDRCYLAGGADFVHKSIVTLRLDESKFIPQPDGGYLAVVQSGLAMDAYLPGVQIPATLFTYLGEGAAKPDNVIYFFMANGKYLGTPKQVRAHGFDPRDEYAYYCKIELGFVGVEDPEEARRLTGEFLEQCLPEILACLPDWRDVRAGRWPRPGSAGAPAQPADQP